MHYTEKFDVIVIGGGHAGTEAALAPARMGLKTLLLTHNIETIGAMSCNPAIGGIGKGHIVKEIDALGGAMAHAADKGGIQFRTLNASKGPAVRATRAQADRILYKAAIRKAVESQPNLQIFMQAVDDLIIEGDGEGQRVTGVRTEMGLSFSAKTVILTVGTFLGGKIHIGLQNHAGGRAGDPPSIALADRLIVCVKCHFVLIALKLAHRLVLIRVPLIFPNCRNNLAIRLFRPFLIWARQKTIRVKYPVILRIPIPTLMRLFTQA